MMPVRRYPYLIFYSVESDEVRIFFDPDWIFDAQFVKVVNALLDAEGGTCACLSNLGAATGVAK